MMSHRRMRALVAVVGGALLAASVWAAGPSVTALRVQPEQIVIEHARDSRGVLVSGRTDAGEWVDLTSQAEFVDVPAS
ncbi:hypothetical protein HN937_00005, partial [Candidatus Poribacteria bacterium]|nr:hypothetical protein [Candidatus Poribacteria bacterium]